MIHFDMPPQKSSIIKVLGFGGGGGNAVNHMFQQQIENVDFIVCNTDSQALAQSTVPNKIQLGPHLTQGLGAGANPLIGKQATEESLEEIRRMLEVNTKMAFITAGMGGGTGTGGAPTVAKICKELGILTVGIVTTPFGFEGPKRMAQAQAGINELKSYVDTLLVISNDKLRHQYGNLKMKEAFSKADDVLGTAARCITDVINTTGQMNVDFADVCTVMRDGGVAILGSALVAGEDRALKAIEAAINSPLLNDNDISGAKWILLNITSSEGDHEYTMDEVEIIQNYIREQAGDNTDVILGMGYDSTLGDKLGITIIATGFRHKDPFAKPEVKKEAPKPEAPIVMILGKEGEENKIYGNAAAPQELRAAAAPVVAEAPAAPVFQAPEPAPVVMQEPEALAPVLFDPEQPEVNQQAEVAEDAPTYFELSLDVSAQPAAAAMPAPVEEPAPVFNAQPAQVSAGGFLSKPSQIYNAPQPPAAPVEEVVNNTTPFIAEEPKQEIVAEVKAEELIQPLILKEEVNEEEEAVSGISMSIEELPFMPKVQGSLFNGNSIGADEDLSEEEEQKRRAQERINRLRNLSFNPMHMDNNSEFENVPAYMRRNMELHNSIANVEDFYSRAQVKTDDSNQATISTLNNFLHGERPD